MELGFIDPTGKMRLSHANELVQHYSQMQTEEEMPQNECDSIIRPCVQYILGYADDNLRIEYVDFRNQLITDKISKDSAIVENLKEAAYFYKKTTVRTLINLLDSSQTAEFDIVESNFKTLIVAIWEKLDSDEKYFIGTAYSRYKNEGNQKVSDCIAKTLIRARGFNYVPENLQSLEFIQAAKNIKKVHYAVNNYYNEPSSVRYLEHMGNTIPKGAMKECIGAVLIVLMGNSYGRSFDAVEPAYAVLDKLTQDDWQM